MKLECLLFVVIMTFSLSACDSPRIDKKVKECETTRPLSLKSTIVGLLTEIDKSDDYHSMMMETSREGWYFLSVSGHNMDTVYEFVVSPSWQKTGNGMIFSMNSQTFSATGLGEAGTLREPFMRDVSLEKVSQCAQISMNNHK